MRSSVLIILLCAVALTGCKQNPEDRPIPHKPSKLPKLNDPKFRYEPAVPESVRPKHAPVRLAVLRFEVPLGKSVEPAWAKVTDQAMAPSNWATNGLVMGRLAHTEADAFYKLLPAPENVATAQLTITSGIATFPTTPPVKRPQIILLDRDGKSFAYGFRAGQFQFIIRVVAVKDNEVQLTLIPHHYQNKQRLVPLEHHERLLEGEIFEELAATFTLRPDESVMIAMTQVVEPEKPEKEEAAPEAASEVPASQPAENESKASAEQAESEPPKPAKLVIPDHLGRVLLVASGRRGPIQMVLMLRMQTQQ